jgi:hypothetical protein
MVVTPKSLIKYVGFVTLSTVCIAVHDWPAERVDG